MKKLLVLLFLGILLVNSSSVEAQEINDVSTEVGITFYSSTEKRVTPMKKILVRDPATIKTSATAIFPKTNDTRNVEFSVLGLLISLCAWVLWIAKSELLVGVEHEK